MINGLTVDPEFKAIIPPLRSEEASSLMLDKVEKGEISLADARPRVRLLSGDARQ